MTDFYEVTWLMAGKKRKGEGRRKEKGRERQREDKMVTSFFVSGTFHT